jgi:hypothetical protein
VEKKRGVERVGVEPREYGTIDGWIGRRRQRMGGCELLLWWWWWWWRKREDERDWITEELSVAHRCRGVWRNLICLGSGVIHISSSVRSNRTSSE